MLCDELKPLIFSISDLAYVDEIRVTKNFQNPHDHAVYKATEVDAAIAELKAENRKLEQEIERLKQENEMSLIGVNLHSPTSDGRLV